MKTNRNPFASACCFLFVLLLSLPVKGQNLGVWKWALQLGSATSQANIERVVLAPNGYLYVAGWYEGSVSFAGQILSSASSSTTDMFLWKLDTLGVTQWVRGFGSATASDDLGDLVVDAGGNAYVTGYVGAAASFGSITPTAFGGKDIYVARCSNTGTWTWAKVYGNAIAAGWEQGLSLALDITGYVYATVRYANSFAFSNYQSVSGPGYTDYGLLQFRASDGATGYVKNYRTNSVAGLCADSYGFVYVPEKTATTCILHKYDPTGAEVRTRTLGNNMSFDRMKFMNGRIYSTGFNSAPVTIDGFTLAYGGEPFIGSMDTGMVFGNYLKDVEWNGVIDDMDMSQDDYMTIVFRTHVPITFNNGSTMFPFSGSNNDGLIVQYDPAGNTVVAERGYFFNIADDGLKGLAVKNRSTIYTGGYFEGDIQCGNSVLYNPTSLYDNGVLMKATLPSATPKQHVNCDWMSTTGTPSVEDSAICSVLDPAGNLIVAGANNGQLTLIKYGPGGNVILQKSYATGYIDPRGLDIDPNGNIYLAGVYYSTINLDGHLLGTSQQAAVIARFDPSFLCLWAQGGGAASTATHAYGISVDKTPSHNIYVVGNYTTSATFGPFTPTGTSGQSTGYLAKLDTLGNFQYVFNTGSSTSGFVTKAVLADNAANVVLTGYHSSNFTIGTVTYSQNSLFIAKYDPFGTVLWTNDASGASNIRGDGTHLKGDASGNYYLLGSLLNTLDFHNGVTIASLSKSANCYVAKYSSTGVCQWARGDISLSNDRNKGMALDAAGNLLVYGHFNQLINKAGNVNNLFSYETPPVASTSGTQLMFAKYSPAGVHLWSQAVRGTKDLVGTSIQYNTAGGFIYCTGAFNNTSTIDGQTMTWSGGANNYHDWFVGRFTDLDNCTMTASLTTTAPACNGSNGALSAIVSGGAAPYTYRWSDGSAASSLSGLSAGAYTVTVKDTLGCAATASVQLGFRISTTIASTVTCAGGTNGSAKATVYGGSGPYTYSWSANAGAASQNNNLPGGSQSVTVTDGSGCALTANFNMPQPGIIKSIMFHSNDSIWVAAPLYGTGPFIYQWSTGSTATGIGNCSYTTPYWVKVTDSKGCISPQDTTIITEPAHWVWVTPGKSSTSSSNISAMLASDASGHLYSAGIISNTVTIGTYTVNGGPSGIPYLAKFDSVGVPVWIKTYGTTIYIRDNETDAAGNIYITGTLSGTATFGSFTLTSSGSGDMFLVKYNSAGTALWASRSSGAGFEFGQALTTDAAGNIYVGGDFSGAGTWGVYSYTASSQDMFVAKYNGSTGACMWAKKGGGTGNEYIRSMTIESSGNILVLTDFNQSPTFGSFTLNSNGQSDIGVVRYNASSGLEQMAMSFGSLRNDASTDIVSDPSGNYYVSLSLSDTIPFATDTVTLDASNNSAAVIKFSSAGAYLGYYQVHGFGASYLAGMAMSSTGELYLSAYYNRKIQLEGNYYLLARNYNPVSSSEDIAIIKIDPVTMRVLWVNSTGGKATDYGTVLTMNKGDNALYGYSYSMGNNLEYDPFILNSQLLSTLDAVWGRLTDIPALGASYTAAAPTCNNGANGSATVTPTGGLAPYTYAWSPGSYTTQTVNTLSPGNYTVTVTDAAMNIFNVTVSISNPAPVTVNGNAALSSICSGDSTTITASGASTYSWAPPAGLSATSGTVVTADPTATTSYTITGTNALGCSNTATVTLTVNTTPAVSASAVTATICSGSSVTLNGSGAATYSWQPGNLSGNNVSVSPAATATYTLTGTSSGCSDTTSVTVNVLMTPTVSYTESTTVVCSGDGPFALTPGTPAGGVYSGAGVSGNTFDPWTAGTGTITVTYAWTDTVNSCTGTASSAIVVNTCVGMAGAGNIPGISASPNPFSASLRIEGVRGLTLVKLTNALGEMIYSGTIHSASVINTAELVNGVYFLHLETEGEITIRKMVKQE